MLHYRASFPVSPHLPPMISQFIIIIGVVLEALGFLCLRSPKPPGSLKSSLEASGQRLIDHFLIRSRLRQCTYHRRPRAEKLRILHACH